MNDELRKLVEGCARGDNGTDAIPVGIALLAEHPVDDDELVTEQWLRSVGSQEISGTGPHAWGFGLFACVAVNIDGSLALTLDRYRITLVNRIATRRDVRRLCAALGIELKEPK